MTTSLQKARELFSKRDRATRSGGLNLSPESGKTSFPVCPECGSGVVFDSDKDTWRCADGLCYWEGESDSFNLYDEGLTNGDMECGIPIGITGLDGGHRIIPGQVWRGPGSAMLRVIEVGGDPANVIAAYVGGRSEKALGSRYIERLSGWTRDRTLWMTS